MPRTKLDIKSLPASITAERDGNIGFLRLSRPEKRNALNDTLVGGIETFFAGLPEDIRAVVLSGDGDHFSAGLDLSELTVRTTVESVHHSRNWHRVFDMFEFGKVPVVAVLHGAVVGGGLELAAACHIRVAEQSAYYALPEGVRGIYVGGGGSVRIPRLIGVSRMMDMMLTGRTYGAEEGLAMGLSHYLVEPAKGLEKGIEIARRIAENTSITNYAIMNALPRIADGDRPGGYMMEALMAAIASGSDEAQSRLKDFLEKRAPKALHNKG
ncbi:MAG: crotonase/enoyl-CoA hydratase family protein [Pseudorhodoplanes sp.]